MHVPRIRHRDVLHWVPEASHDAEPPVLVYGLLMNKERVRPQPKMAAAGLMPDASQNGLLCVGHRMSIGKSFASS